MAEINTSFYGAIPAPQPINPLGVVSQFAQVQNAVNQNRMFQQEYKARQAMGPLAQQAVDKDTGQMDYNKFATMISAHPDTAWKAPEILNLMVQRQLTQAQTLKASLETEKERMGIIQGGLSSLLGQKTPLSPIDVAKILWDPVYSKAIPDSNMRMDILKSAPTDDKGIRDWAKQKLIQAAGANERLTAIAGNPTFQNLGGSIQAVSPSAVTGQLNPIGQPMDISPTPEQKNQLAKSVDPRTGRTLEEPRATIAPMQTGLGRPAPGTSGAGQSTDGAAATPSGPNVQDRAGSALPGPDGAYGSDAVMMSKGPAGLPDDIAPGQRGGRVLGMDVQAVAPGAKPKALVAELGPGEKKEMEKFGEYASELKDLVSTADSNTRIMKEMLESTNKFKTGGGASILIKAAQALQAVGAKQEWVDKVAGGSLPDAQEFEKLSAQLGALMMRQFIGSGQRYTNIEFDKFQKANPNWETDPRAIKKIFSFMEDAYNWSRLEQSALDRWQQGARPKGYEEAPITSFRSWFSKEMNEKSPAMKLNLGKS